MPIRLFVLLFEPYRRTGLTPDPCRVGGCSAEMSLKLSTAVEPHEGRISSLDAPGYATAASVTVHSRRSNPGLGSRCAERVTRRACRNEEGSSCLPHRSFTRPLLPSSAHALSSTAPSTPAPLLEPPTPPFATASPPLHRRPLFSPPARTPSRPHCQRAPLPPNPPGFRTPLCLLQAQTQSDARAQVWTESGRSCCCDFGT